MLDALGGADAPSGELGTGRGVEVGRGPSLSKSRSFFLKLFGGKGGCFLRVKGCSKRGKEETAVSRSPILTPDFSSVPPHFPQTRQPYDYEASRAGFDFLQLEGNESFVRIDLFNC